MPAANGTRNRQTKQPLNNKEDRYVSVSKHDATRAEYDRCGGVGIAHGQAIKIPSKVLLPERPIHVLLMRAKCLRLGARSAFSPCFRIPAQDACPLWWANG